MARTREFDSQTTKRKRNQALGTLSSEGPVQRTLCGSLCWSLEPRTADGDVQSPESPAELRASFARKYKTEQEELLSDHKYNREALPAPTITSKWV